MHTASRRPAKVIAALALVALCAFVLSACGTDGTAANTWLQPNQNSSNTRYVGGRITTNTANILGVAWTANLRTAAGNSSQPPTPLITKTNVFVHGPGGRLVSYNLETGALDARATIKVNALLRVAGYGNIPRANILKLSPELAPILTTGNDDAQIVVGADENTVAALNLKGGTKAWSRTISSPSNTRAVVISNMAAAHDTIYAPVANVPTDVASRGLGAAIQQVTASKKNNGQLVAINAENGKVSWTKKLASVPLGAATVVNDVVFTSTLDGHVYGFDAGSGDQVFSSPLPAGAFAPLSASNATLVVPAGFVYKRGQKAQVVAFSIGGLGVVGGAAPPKIKQQSEGAVAGAAAPSAGAKPAAAAGPDGAKLFSENCAGCHTLKAANASGTTGPDLDQLKPSEAVVDKQVTNGGGVMPAFKNTLTPAEITAIAKFVSENAGK